MNNKDLNSGRTLTTFYSVIAQLVSMCGNFSGIDELFSSSSTILRPGQMHSTSHPTSKILHVG